MALQQLTHCIRELRAAVVERQGGLALALEDSRSRREQALSAQVSEKQGLLENAGLMAYSQELLKETDAPCFVQAARVTHNRYLQQTYATHISRINWLTYFSISIFLLLFLYVTVSSPPG